MSRARGLRGISKLATGAALALALLAGCGAPSRTEPPSPQVVVNTIGMRLVRVPAGSFVMGSEETPAQLAKDFRFDDPKRYTDLSDEAPAHRVRITRDYFLGQHEVTVGQFRAFVQASGHVPESIADGTGGYGYNAAFAADVNRTGDAFEGRDPRFSWQNPGFAQGEDHPVVNVTWHDAVAMAAWLTKTEGRRYRLPTEAEWEYACRAGRTTRFQTGDDPRSLPKAANLFDQDSAAHWPKWAAQAVPGHDGYDFTAPVGRFQANDFGLYDMHGNAWEWTADYYGEDYYAHSPTDDPQGPASGNVRVRRGGSWHTWAFYARCSFRNWNTEETRYPLVGFRLVMEAP